MLLAVQGDRSVAKTMQLVVFEISVAAIDNVEEPVVEKDGQGAYDGGRDANISQDCNIICYVQLLGNTYFLEPFHHILCEQHPWSIPGNTE